MQSRRRFKTAHLSQDELDYLQGLSYHEKLKQIDEDYDLKWDDGTSVYTEILKVLAKDEDFRVRSYIASSSKTPVEVLNILADDDDYSVASSLAFNTNSTPEVFDKLLSWDDSDLNRIIAVHGNIDNKTLISLFEEGLYINREDAITLIETKKDLPTPIIVKLYNDHPFSQDLQKEIVFHKNTPDYLLLDLIAKDSYVAKYISFRDNLPEAIALELIKGANVEIATVLGGLLDNSNTGPGILNKIAHDYPSYSHSVAAHKNTSSETLDYLANFADALTVRAVINNPNTLPHSLEKAHDSLKRNEEKQFEANRELVSKRISETPGYPEKLLGKTDGPILGKTNSDLELLLRLKSHLKNS